jgi:hypothetical protein
MMAMDPGLLGQKKRPCEMELYQGITMVKRVGEERVGVERRINFFLSGPRTRTSFTRCAESRRHRLCS